MLYNIWCFVELLLYILLMYFSATQISSVTILVCGDFENVDAKVACFVIVIKFVVLIIAAIGVVVSIHRISLLW